MDRRPGRHAGKEAGLTFIKQSVESFFQADSDLRIVRRSSPASVNRDGMRRSLYIVTTDYNVTQSVFLEARLRSSEGSLLFAQSSYLALVPTYLLRVTSPVVLDHLLSEIQPKFMLSVTATIYALGWDKNEDLLTTTMARISASLPPDGRDRFLEATDGEVVWRRTTGTGGWL